jgi:hypothetical protein
MGLAKRWRAVVGVGVVLLAALGRGSCMVGGGRPAGEMGIESVRVGDDGVLASGEGGIYRLDLRRHEWRQVTTPVGMPRGMQFGESPKGSRLIYAWSEGSLRRGEPLRGNSLWVSEDGGATWRHVSDGDFRSVVLVENGTVYAVLGRDFGKSKVVMSKDGGRSWRTIWEYWQCSWIWPDPDHPGLVCISFQTIRGNVAQALDERFQWTYMMEMEWGRRHPGQYQDWREYWGRTRIDMLQATFGNYFDFPFGNHTELPAFDVVPLKTSFVFARNGPKPVEFEVRFESATAAVLADQARGTDFYSLVVPRGQTPEEEQRTLEQDLRRLVGPSKVPVQGVVITHQVDQSHPYRKQIDLDKLYQFDRAGRYRVHLVYSTDFVEQAASMPAGAWLGGFGGEAFDVEIVEGKP